MRKNRWIYPVMILSLVLVACYLPFAVTGCGGPSKGGKALYYCPMHPTYTSDRPGDCPICNMKLVKKEEAAPMAAKPEEHKGHTAPPPAQAEEKTLEEVCLEHSCTMKDCPMHVKVAMRPGERMICPICGEIISTANGKVVEIARQTARPTGPTVEISAQKQQLIGVKIEPVRVARLEKIVRASGKIAYDPELVVTQEEYIQALKNEENTKDSPLQDVQDRAAAMTDAAKSKLKLLGMGEDQISELERTKRAQTGLYLPGKGEDVWAYIAIYEYEIGLVQPGAGVELEVTAYPGETFRGTVMSINPVLDPMTRTNQARVRIPNPDNKLKPEMFASADIHVDLGEKLAVPESAVLDTGIRKIVYISREGDLLESREVTLGQKAEGLYEVLGGLDEGEMVVTSGNFLVDSESKLKAQMAGTPEHQH